MSNFIDSFSWKCLLGPQSKNINTVNGGIYLWTVGKKQHFATSKILDQNDLPALQSLKASNFHYLSEQNFLFLKQNFKNVDKGKNTSVYFDLTKLTLSGKKNSSLRHSINQAQKNDFIIQDTFNNLSDIKTLIKEWSNSLAEKYFRDFSGKNYYFFAQNFHIGCHTIFVYDKEGLVSFGVASPGVNGHSTYVMGKALCNKYKGLSEYTDYLLYQKIIDEGIHTINLGQASKGLYSYKMKFPGACETIHFDGSYSI